MPSANIPRVDSFVAFRFGVGMQLRVEPLHLTLRERWSTSRTREGRVAQTLVVMLEQGGAVGFGEAAPISRYGETIASADRFLAGVEASRLSDAGIGRSMEYLDTVRAGECAAKSAINCALLDLAAQKAGRRLHEFLGLDFHEGRHVTSLSIGIDGPERIQRKVEAAASYPLLKVKLGVEDDRAILRAVRRAAPEKTIRVDANEGWKDRAHALDMIRYLAADGRVEFVEQPMPAGSPVEDLIWLKKRSPLPLVADESFHTVADVAACREAFHGVNVKLSKTGGLTGAILALTAAREAGLRTMIGCMVESSIGISAAAHLAPLADHLDLDGNLLVENDPFEGVESGHGLLSFASAAGRNGLMVRRRESDCAPR